MSETDLLVVEDVWGTAFETLSTRLRVERDPQLCSDRDRLVERARGARGIVVRNRTQVDAELIAALPDLEVVGRAGVGLDNIDLGAADHAGVVVVAALGANALSVAEHTLALALALARDIVVHDRKVRRGVWERTPGSEIAGRTWGLLGAGATGQAVGRVAGALGARVIAYDPAGPELAGTGIELTGLDQVIEKSDVLSIHLPSTPQTRNLVDADLLRRMRSSALLVNVGRGDVVDEAALADALESGQIAGAALDVRASEPPEQGRLEKLDNVVLTPHIAGITDEAQERIVELLANDIETLFAGNEASNAVSAARSLTAGKAPA